MRRAIPWLVLAAVPLAASADIAQQPGLWEVTVTIQQGSQMPQLPPEAIELMKQAGLQNPFGTPIVRDICVTPEQVRKDAVPNFNDADSGCAVTNGKRTKDTLTADLVCDGQLHGKGDIAMTLSSPTAYTGTSRFKGTSADGIDVDMDTTIAGRFLASSCGSVKPF